MFSPEIPRQVGEARAEWKILQDIAAATYPDRANLLGCETGSKMREEIARIIPFYEGIQNLRETGDAIQYDGPHLCANSKFNTPDGKAHFRAVPLPENGMHEAESHEVGRGVPTAPPNGTKRMEIAIGSSALFKVSTRRGKQFNSLIYAETDPINGAPRDAVLMNPDDAADLHLIQNDRIALANNLGRYEGHVFLAPIARGNLQIHWPEGNVIIRRGVTEPTGGVPDYNAKAKVVKIG
jgi:anaerobic selenocysteine-containing dehydrogenase